MQVRGAVIERVNQPLVVQDLELDDPRDFEVLIDLKACGVCHSDDHVLTGDIPMERLPVLCGHEGAGIVEKVGPGVNSVRPGDHVCTSFIPSCGRCRWCATGRMYLCDLGAELFSGKLLDGTHRFHQMDGTGVGQMCMLGEFATKTVVPEQSIVQIPKTIPLDLACLLSCGVVTGWGSAVARGDVRPGDTVVVWGVGGVGANAVQGAVHAGAKKVFAVDPSDFKLEQAKRFGATDTINNDGIPIEAVLEPIHAVTNGQGADVCIMAPGVGSAEMIGEAFQAIAKDGTLVVTGASPMDVNHLQINALNLTMFNKQIRGSVYGSMNPRHAIPHLIDLYQAGLLKLDELITRRFDLDGINEAFDDMRSGRVVRGVLIYE
jgi:NDMA-dependent alcohol dehydrogenase